MKTPFDNIIQQISDYALNTNITSELAYETAYYDLLDALACGIQALQFPACTKLLGPVVPGAVLPNGARVPGTDFTLEPVQAAFNIGAMIRWLDFNDTWLAAEWGHPSDNLGGLLAVADYLNRNERKNNPITVKDLLSFMIKAIEIQGVFALENSFNRVGLDHVVLVKVASTASITAMLGGTIDQVNNAVSQAWLDGQSLRTYRHAPNTGSRKSWAAGDATSRAVRLSLMSMAGEMGYPSALSAKTWGFYEVLFKGKPFTLSQPFASYTIENILFKIAFPAEFHAQTAAECAFALHEQVKDRLDDIDFITVETQEAAMRIISKQGSLNNPADRDHCLEYIIATSLIFGELTAQHYEDDVAKDTRIDALRATMQVSENQQFSVDYLDPEKRSIANAIQVFFKDGSKTERVCVEYPVGHRRRREEGIPLLIEKFEHSMQGHFEGQALENILALKTPSDEIFDLPIDQWLSFFAQT